MIFDIDLNKIPDEALPAIHELPDDLRLMAEIIGDVRLVLKVAMAFRGTPIRTGGTKTILIGIRDFLIRRGCDAGDTILSQARQWNLDERSISKIRNQPDQDEKPVRRQLKLFGDWQPDGYPAKNKEMKP